MREESVDDVGKEDECEPLEDARDSPVTGPEQERDDNQRVERSEIERRQSGDRPVTLAMPPRSAPMLTTFATTSKTQAPHRTQRGEWRRTTPARPSPVTRPSRAHMI